MRNYISKLNDRNLQRKRESGLTTYALISVLFILIYKIFEYYPLVPLKTNFIEVLIIMTYTINIVIGVLSIYSIYEVTLGHLSSIRVVSKSKTNERLLENVLDFSLIIIPLGLNITIYANSIINGIFWNWYFISIIAVLLFVFIVIIYLSFKERKINQPYEIFEGTGNTGTDKDFFSILTYILSSLCIGFSLYRLYTINVDFGRLNTMVFGIIFYAMPLLLVKIIELQKKDRFTTSLENLEYEINVRDLKDDEIREKLQKNYMGFLLIEWITYNLSQLEKFKRIIEAKKNDVSKLKIELNAIDFNRYPLEYKGRKEKITEKENEIVKLTDKFFNSKLNEIESIWTDRKLEPNERRELSNLYNKIKFEKIKYADK